MHYQHEAQLANIVTSYCTCLAGLMPLLFTLLGRKQPARWVVAYSCMLITGIPTVWLHSMEGYRLASFFDVGTNILLAWAAILAVSGDFMQRESRRKLLIVITPIDVAVIGWLLWEVFAAEKVPLIRFGDFGQFYTGQVALIANAWVAAILFVKNVRRIPHHARALMWLTLIMFFMGMLLATASKHQVSGYILAWHATWHVIGAFGFISLWAFNDLRFHNVASKES